MRGAFVVVAVALLAVSAGAYGQATEQPTPPPMTTSTMPAPEGGMPAGPRTDEDTLPPPPASPADGGMPPMPSSGEAPAMGPGGDRRSGPLAKVHEMCNADAEVYCASELAAVKAARGGRFEPPAGATEGGEDMEAGMPEPMEQEEEEEEEEEAAGPIRRLLGLGKRHHGKHKRRMRGKHHRGGKGGKHHRGGKSHRGGKGKGPHGPPKEMMALGKCMISHFDELSTGCQKAMGEMKQHMMSKGGPMGLMGKPGMTADFEEGDEDDYGDEYGYGDEDEDEGRHGHHGRHGRHHGIGGIIVLAVIVLGVGCCVRRCCIRRRQTARAASGAQAPRRVMRNGYLTVETNDVETPTEIAMGTVVQGTAVDSPAPVPAAAMPAGMTVQGQWPAPGPVQYQVVRAVPVSGGAVPIAIAPGAQPQYTYAVPATAVTSDKQ